MESQEWDEKSEGGRKSDRIIAWLNECMAAFPAGDLVYIEKTRQIAMSVENWRDLPLEWVFFGLLDCGEYDYANTFSKQIANVFANGAGSVSKDLSLSAFWQGMHEKSIIKRQKRDEIKDISSQIMEGLFPVGT